MKNEYVLKLSAALANLQQNSIIPYSDRFQKLLESCETLLEKNGRKILHPPKIYSMVTNAKLLVEHFYQTFSFKHPDMLPKRDEIVDLVIAKSFIKRVQEDTGYAYLEAVKLCAELVAVLFKYEEEFNFNNEIYTSMRVFGQDKMRWITDKILDIVNNVELKEAKDVMVADKIAEEYLRTHDVDLSFPGMKTGRKK